MNYFKCFIILASIACQITWGKTWIQRKIRSTTLNETCCKTIEECPVIKRPGVWLRQCPNSSDKFICPNEECECNCIDLLECPRLEHIWRTKNFIALQQEERCGWNELNE